MRVPVASLSFKLLSVLFSVTLAFGLMPTTAFAASDGLQPVPGGSEGVASSTSSAEGGDEDVFSHCPSDDASSVDRGDAAASAEDVYDMDDARPSATRPADLVSEDVALTPVIARAESVRSYLLAQTLESTRTVPIVSANLPLDTGSADVADNEASEDEEDAVGDDPDREGDPAPVDASFSLHPENAESAVSAESTVIGSFTYRGITYAVEPGGESVAVVAADYTKLPEEFIEAQAIVLPSMVTNDALDYYTVVRIADHAFASINKNVISSVVGEGDAAEKSALPMQNREADTDSADGVEDEISSMNENPLGITTITIPASVTSVGDDAFTGFDTLQYVIVSEDNPIYAQRDGCLYDVEQDIFLYAPEGREGAEYWGPTNAEGFNYVYLGMFECADERELDANLARICEEVGSVRPVLSNAFSVALEGAPVEVLVYNGSSFALATIALMQSEQASFETVRATQNATLDELPNWIRKALSDLRGTPSIELYDANTTDYSDGEVVSTAEHNFCTVGSGYSISFDVDCKGKSVGDSVTYRPYENGHNTANSNTYVIRYHSRLGFCMYHNSGNDQRKGYYDALVKVASAGDSKAQIVKCSAALTLRYATATSPFGALPAKTTWNVLLPTPADFDVIWNSNGGTTISDWTVLRGEDRVLSDALEYNGGLPTPTRDGFSFIGWYKGASSGCFDWSESNKVSASTIIDDTTYLYAYWKIDFNWYAYGGRAAKSATTVYSPGEAAATASYSDVSATTPTSSTYVPTGWQLYGWSKEQDPTSDSSVASAGASIKAYSSTNDNAYYARWQAQVRQDLNYDGKDVTVLDALYASGESPAVTKSVTNPVREGYPFLGWQVDYEDESLEDEFVPVVEGSNSTSIAFKGAATITAQWKPQLSVVLRTEASDDGSYVKGSDRLVDRAVAGALPWSETAGSVSATEASYLDDTSKFALPDIEREGYAFLGWKRTEPTSDDVLREVVIDPMEQAASEEYSYTYAPVFEAVSYTILFDPGTADVRELVAIPTTYDAEDPVTAPIPVARGKGDVFLRWGLSTDSLAGWKRSEAFTIEEVFAAGYRQEDVEHDVAIGGETYANVVRLHGVWAPCVTAELPLYVSVYIDTESSDTLSGEGRLSTSYGDEVRILSLAYDKAESSLLGGGTDHVLGDAPEAAVLIVSPVRSDAEGEDDVLFAQAAPFGLSLGSESVSVGGALASFPTFGKDGVYLRLRYDISFTDGFDLTRLRLPDNDHAGANGVSATVFPIAKLYYTIGLV